MIHAILYFTLKFKENLCYVVISFSNTIKIHFLETRPYFISNECDRDVTGLSSTGSAQYLLFRA